LSGRRVLLDENLPHRLRVALPKHEAFTAVYAGFGGYKNGALLQAAEEAGFDVLVTGDISFEYQQNMTGRKIAVVSLSANSWQIVKHHVAKIAFAVDQAGPGSVVRVDCGSFTRSGKAPGTRPG
jgi:hypothetical protein